MEVCKSISDQSEEISKTIIVVRLKFLVLFLNSDCLQKFRVDLVVPSFDTGYLLFWKLLLNSLDDNISDCFVDISFHSAFDLGIL